MTVTSMDDSTCPAGHPDVHTEIELALSLPLAVRLQCQAGAIKGRGSRLGVTPLSVRHGDCQCRHTGSGSDGRARRGSLSVMIRVPGPFKLAPSLSGKEPFWSELAALQLSQLSAPLALATGSLRLGCTCYCATQCISALMALSLRYKARAPSPPAVPAMPHGQCTSAPTTSTLP
jgi:hypothetical protein